MTIAHILRDRDESIVTVEYAAWHLLQNGKRDIE